MKKLDRLKNLAVMSAVDGSLSENEISLLIDRSQELGLTEEQLEQAISFALSQKTSLAMPRNEDQQEAALEDLIRMMAADGQLVESEKRLFALTAAKVGFPQNRLDQLIMRLVNSVTDPH